MTSKQLFEAVELNDSISLAKLINGKKPVNLDISNKGYLIEKAINFRSKECFDILLTKQIDLSNGLNATIKLLADPNLTNRYYFDNLVIKLGKIKDINYSFVPNKSNFLQIIYDLIIKWNIKFDYSLILEYDNPEQFTELLTRINQQELYSLIYNYIENPKGFEKIIWDWLETEKPSVYSDIKSIKRFNSHALAKSIQTNNFTLIKFIMEKPVEWKHHNSYHETAPILYLSLHRSSEEIFQYFYQKFLELPADEIKQISSIDTFKPLINIHFIHEYFKQPQIQRYRMIMQNLPVIFNRDDTIWLMENIIYYLLRYSNNDNNSDDYLWDFLVWLFDYVKIHWVDFSYQPTNIELIKKVLIDPHDNTYSKITKLFKYYPTYTKQEIDLIAKYIMCNKLDIPEKYKKFISKDLSNSWEYHNCTFNSNEYHGSGFRYTEEFDKYMKRIKPIFNKYGFVVNEFVGLNYSIN